MSPAGAFRPWLVACFVLGAMSYFTANEEPMLGVVVVGAILAARWLLVGAPWKEDAPNLRAPFPHWLLNALSLLAVIIAFQRGLATPDQFVTALGGTLIWLQGVMWFEKARVREEGRLLVLSLFTMVAACLTSNSLILGAMLFVYVPVAVRTTLLLEVRATAARANRPGVGLHRASARQLRRVAISTSLVCAIGATALFVVLPRSASSELFGAWANPGAGAQIGYSDEVVLGREGELQGNEEPILDMLLTDAAGNNIGSAERPVYLRGNALDEYDPAHGVWRRSASAGESSLSYSVSPLIPAEFGRSREAGVVTQKITIRNRQGDTVFAAARPIRLRIDRNDRLQVGRHDTVLALTRRSGRIVYSVDSVPDYTPSAEPDPPPQPPMFGSGRIREYADQILASAGLARAEEERYDESDLRIVRAFERALQTGYEYDATMTAPQAGEDPIEMFLFRTRRGHCSYFASALAALCRSVGVDARVISGYRASEFNDLTGLYVVRQGHAHAWVEANTAPGVWIVADPSPVAGVTQAHRARGGVVGALRTAKEAAEHVWITWVVGYDQNRRMSIFGVPKLDVGGFNLRLERLTSLNARQLSSRLLWAGAIGVGAFLLAAGVLFSIRATLRRWVRQRAERRKRAVALARSAPEDTRLAMEIARQLRFYERVLGRWRAAGREKPTTLPPLRHARRSLSDVPAASSASARLVDLYYAARFGARSLTPQELEEVTRLERALSESFTPGA